MTGHKWDPSCVRPAGLVAPVRVDPTGLLGPTRHQAAGPRFRQTSPGRYVPATVDETLVEQRILEQASRLGRHGAVTGWAALRWRGARFFDGTGDGGRRIRPIPLVVGLGKIREDPRVQISQAQIAPSEYTKVGGIYCATVQRALFDEMRFAPDVRSAVVAMDMVAAARMNCVRFMSMYVAQRSSWTGVEQVRDALALASDHRRSPQETRMGLVWELDAGLKRPLFNPPVFSLDGRLLGYPDLLDVEAGCVGEYDGEDHKERERHRRDVAREQEFRDHGLEYFTVVGGDLSDHTKVVGRIHSARRRASFAPESSRQWTLEPPSWWKPEEPLDVHLVRTCQAAELIRT
jgi:hypothetical protein